MLRLRTATFLPGLPSIRFCYPKLSRFAPLRYYAGADSWPASLRPPGLPVDRAHPSRHSAANPVDGPDIVFNRQPQRVRCVSGFAITEQARRRSPPNRVRFTADCRFASGCSPPRLTATQFPSATGPWLTRHGLPPCCVSAFTGALVSNCDKQRRSIAIYNQYVTL